MLRKFSGQRFEKQYPVLSLWQELAENFYPERNDFLRTHFIGEELTDSLASSQPLLIRRELANSLEAMLRDGEWFSIGIEDEPDHEGKMWLEWATKRLMMLMNQRNANFRRATKELDNDYGMTRMARSMVCSARKTSSCTKWCSTTARTRCRRST
jgi:hypothetical protein